MAVLEFEPAADPLPRNEAPGAERAVVAMEAPAAVAHEQAAGGIGEQLAERIDAIGQRHRAEAIAPPSPGATRIQPEADHTGGRAISSGP